MIAHDPKNLRRVYFENAQSSSNLIGDWAATPADGIFTINEPSMRICSLWIKMKVDETIDPIKFGNGDALSAGISFSVERNDVLIHSISSAIKTNEDFEMHFQRQNTISDKSFMGPYLLYIGYAGSIAQKTSALDKLVITSTENLTGRATVLEFYALGLIGQE